MNRLMEKWRGQLLVVAGGIVLYLLIGLLVWWLLKGYVVPSDIDDASTRATAKKDLVQALGLIMAGLAGVIGIFLTWRGQRLTQLGQITERFTRAIDQLGATHDGKRKNLELRLGGIFALERISKESEEDHWSIMEVLTAYVRQQTLEVDAAVAKKREEDLRGESEPSEVPNLDNLDADIQAIMTILRRRTRYYEHGEPERLDLRKAYLVGADLRGAKLLGARLSGAKLSKARLSRADLSKARLRRANLNGADLRDATFSGTIFEGADLRGAKLLGATFEGADLRGADFSGAEGLDMQQIEKTIGDHMTTKLPKGERPPAHWSTSFEEEKMRSAGPGER